MQSPRPSIVFTPMMKLLAAGVTLALAYILYTAIHDVAIVFFGAAIFAYIFTPLIDWSAPFLRGSRIWATSLFFLILVGVLVLVGMQLGPLITSQYTALRADLPRAIESIKKLSFTVGETTLNIGPQITSTIEARLSSIPASLPRIFVGAIEGFLHTLAFVITSFFLLINGKRVAQVVFELVPAEHQAEVAHVGRHINGILRGYIRGTLLLIPIMAVLTTIALWLLGVRYALLIGIVSGVVEILPIIGPWSAAGFAIVMAVFQHPLPFADSVLVVGGVIGGIYLALRMFEDYVIIPAVVGPAVHLHPILVIAAILGGAAIGGALGLFLAIPVMSVMQYMLRWVYHKLISSDTLPEDH